MLFLRFQLSRTIYNKATPAKVQRPGIATLPRLGPVTAEKPKQDVQGIIAIKGMVNLSPKLEFCDMDEWLQDDICVGESSKPVSDVMGQEVARYLGAAQTDTGLISYLLLTTLQWKK